MGKRAQTIKGMFIVCPQDAICAGFFQLIDFGYFW
jgi:hypothetical protein